ncbi:hypothetical protein F442_06813 [Phytophthora nicotianae P10297]|nr:hypothetical protein L915_06648 [Phytophthora nicotianae]ETL42634.1 hypothetical protein L916_06586 [Phytophthora nicotianae]ETL95804.1 hypothetical protein L917_06457 [Phytophthora nicotianae]ETM48991.1 hypothetical protein L914_06560 [Phytophthora nicotianae]ETP47046.1 hypothetical protein F442_06813 [Phytophthora nicotianae P10297]
MANKARLPWGLPDHMAGSYARGGEMMATEKAERTEYQRRRGVQV